ncbi:MAG TPA: NAD(P)/FAD-dependent oxidoreductase [Gemmatimonadaceae bacterium]|jgi:thioredoxin reductase|nr:NAD(P)/FAD-dependent oxidoreductase [Gemmatimonadaceae bacterium]
MTHHVDIAIIGAGPAGLSAALWSARYLHSTVVIDSGDPRNWETRGVNGYLGLPGITPPELRARGRAEASQAGATFIDAHVSTVSRLDDDDFTIRLDNGMAIVATRLLLAIGIRDVWPDIPGLDRCYGATAHVCPDCDGYEARDSHIVVIGSGRKAMGMALALTTWTRDIVICTNGESPNLTRAWLDQLQTLNIPVLDTRIACARSQHGTLRYLDLEGGMPLDCDHLFFCMGQVPADDLGVQLGCRRDDIGRILTNAHYHTSVPNVYAAGDIVHSTQLAITAAAGGAIAASAMHHSLLPAVRTLAP